MRSVERDYRSCCKTWTQNGRRTFLSLGSLGRLDTETNPTFIKLRYSRLTNSAVRPSIFPSFDLQFSSTSSCTWNKQNVNVTEIPINIQQHSDLILKSTQINGTHITVRTDYRMARGKDLTTRWPSDWNTGGTVHLTSCFYSIHTPYSLLVTNFKHLPFY